MIVNALTLAFHLHSPCCAYKAVLETAPFLPDKRDCCYQLELLVCPCIYMNCFIKRMVLVVSRHFFKATVTICERQFYPTSGSKPLTHTLTAPLSYIFLTWRLDLIRCARYDIDSRSILTTSTTTLNTLIL
jgi:hypothetical protein